MKYMVWVNQKFLVKVEVSFPMIWEEINGEGSAVWSSEIDKNAAAVARYHFPDLTQHISTDC